MNQCLGNYVFNPIILTIRQSNDAVGVQWVKKNL